MKKVVILGVFLIISTITQPCATCIGRLEGDTPPLFTPEYDAHFWPEAQEKMVENHEKNNERSSEKNRKNNV